jgi:presenilin enhancer 2
MSSTHLVESGDGLDYGPLPAESVTTTSTNPSGTPLNPDPSGNGGGGVDTESPDEENEVHYANTPSKWPHSEQIRVSRIMYLGGFAFLPWLWLVNAFFFRHALSRKSAHRAHPEVVSHARKSLLGALLGFGMLFIWMTLYLLERVKWGSLARTIALNYPEVYP